MRTHVQRWGNSLAVRIPKAIAADAGFEDGAEVELRVRERSLVVARPERRYRLSELVAKITPRNRHDETPTGRVAGREIW